MACIYGKGVGFRKIDPEMKKSFASFLKLDEKNNFVPFKVEGKLVEVVEGLVKSLGK